MPASFSSGKSNRTSRRQFLGGAALATLQTVATARKLAGQSRTAQGRFLAYAGTYSSPQGAEGSVGRGQGIYLFEMDPTNGGLSQRALFPNDGNPSWLA